MRRVSPFLLSPQTDSIREFVKRQVDVFLEDQQSGLSSGCGTDEWRDAVMITTRYWRDTIPLMAPTYTVTAPLQ